MIINSLEEYIAALRKVAERTPTPCFAGDEVLYVLADVSDCWAALAAAEREFVIDKKTIPPYVNTVRGMKILPEVEKIIQAAGITWEHLASGVTEKRIGKCSIRTFTAPAY